MFRSKKENGCAEPGAVNFHEAAVKTAVYEAERRMAPRLEPYFYEVKQTMKTYRLTEKDAERHVRKELLENALWQIKDEPTRRLASSLLTLV